MEIINLKMEMISKDFIKTMNRKNIYEIEREGVVKELWIFPYGGVEWLTYSFGWNCGDIPKGWGLSINDGYCRGSYVLHPDQIDALLKHITEGRNDCDKKEVE